ncbi:PREDICTED: furin-like protease 2, partial [Priapulus caudatus]|uniref:Furin-like protease 2 n=1 Tax=Priapulus caudatus TaxID=37621 RepID=A0ABM1F4Q8_PRICU
MLSMHRITASRVHSGGDESCKTTANRPSLMTKSTTWCYTGATVGSKSLSFFKIAIAVICLSCAISTVHAKGGEGDSPHHDGELTYQNQWAVELHGCGEGGAGSCDAVANEIALKHGFVNRGQVGSLEKFYLFEHEHVHKRSLEHSGHMHAHLVKEPQVRWLEQQHIRKRVKRDSLTDKVFDFKDPQFKDQWYLNKGAEKGFDMNVMAAWQKGYTGAGVVVSILDDGIQTDHPDLVDNYDPKASTDINDKDDDPYPQDNGDNKHGTRCAGEVASMAGNDYCGVGVAYKSGIGGVRMLDGDVNDHVEASALSLNPQHIDIYSASWGPEDDGRTVDGPAKLATQAFISGAEKGRNGKGSIFVWASGNGGLHGDNCNCDGYTNSIYTLSISSSSQRNRKPWYLEECTSTLATTYSSGQEGTDKDIMTTDFKDKCTERHTGTSASAPLAAGLCALALEANPDITWRDMQYVVLITANPTPLLEHGEFTETASGRKVSHMFGYGMMDAGAMVALAEQWTTVPEKHICKTKVDMTQHTIPAKGALVVHLDVDGCAKMADQHVRYLEHVQTHVTVEFHRRGDLNMRLISPMGTKSTLLGSRRRDSFSEFKDWPFLSVHYWSENPSGQWSLELTNVGDSFNHGTLKSWYIVFHGTAINPVRIKKDVQLTLTTLQGGGANRVDTSYNMENGLCVSMSGGGVHTGAESTLCLPCHSSCVTCSGGSERECLSCPDHYYSENGTCTLHCSPSFYEDDEQSTCL